MQAASIPSSPGQSVFLSYVPPGEKALRRKLVEALSPLSRRGLITLWSDDELLAGREGALEIARHLQAAQILLLLVCPACLASNEWHSQAETMLARARSGRARVVPVLLRPTVAWQESSFGHLAPLPADGKPVTSYSNQNEGWFAVATGLQRLVEHDPVTIEPPGVAPLVSRQLLTQPPTPHPEKSIPRPQAVAEIYRRLTGPEVSALVLTGIWGLGKSGLAAQICQFAEQQRQSGQGPFLASPLWFTLEETTSLAEVCATLCQASGVTLPEFQSMTPSDLVVTLCDLLQQGPKPRLIVLDQFENWLDPQTRLPRPEHSAVSLWLELLNSRLSSSRLLCTSRLYPHGQRQPLDAYVQRHALTGLSQPEGLQLLLLGHLEESDAELASIISYYQGHPLALAWLRDLLKGHRAASLSALVQDISYKERFAGDLAHSVLHFIYTQQLTDEQRELLLAFAIYRQPVPLPAAQRIVQARRSQPLLQAGEALAVLLDLELLQAVGLLAYRVPPVIRDFVQAQRNVSDLPGAGEQLSLAHQSAAGYYQELCAAALRPPVSPSGDETLLLLEAAWHLCQAGWQSESAHLFHREHLLRDLSRRGENTLLLDLYRCLLPPETWGAEPALAGRLYHEMGSIYNAMGQKSAARLSCERSLPLLRQAGAPALLAAALNDLGTVYRSLDQESQASACYEEAWTLCEQAGEPFPQRGITLNNQGRLLYEQGQEQERQRQKARASELYQEALAHYEQALAAHLRNHLPEEEGWTLLNLADVYASLGQRPQALAHYRQALARFRELGERRGEGTALNNLGLLLAYDPAAGKQSASYYTQALRIFRSTGDRWQERKTLKNLGHWLLISVPKKEPGNEQAYLSSLACFFAARDPLAQPPQSRADLIPAWLLASLRQDLGEPKTEKCVQDAEARSWQIIEELLQLPHDFV